MAAGCAARLPARTTEAPAEAADAAALAVGARAAGATLAEGANESVVARLLSVWVGIEGDIARVACVVELGAELVAEALRSKLDLRGPATVLLSSGAVWLTGLGEPRAAPSSLMRLTFAAAAESAQANEPDTSRPTAPAS